MGYRYTYKIRKCRILVIKSLEKRTFGSSRRKWDNFNIDIKEMLTGLNWLRIAGFCPIAGELVNSSDIRFIYKYLIRNKSSFVFSSFSYCPAIFSKCVRVTKYFCKRAKT
jgi:hypothetical protein